jgi:hypothetical protein
MESIVINITDEQQEVLESLIHKETTDYRLSGRALIILLTAAGEKLLAMQTDWR